MARFLLGRFTQALVTLLFLSILVFLLSRVLGDPVGLLLPLTATPEQHERLTEALGLDQPLYVQYGRYLAQLLSGDLGESFRTREPVSKLIASHLGPSLQLGAAAFIIAVGLGLPLGVIAAVRKGTRSETLAKIAGLIGQTLPPFWVGMLLIQLFAVQLQWLPAGGIGGIEHLVLPAFTQSLFLLAAISRLGRTSMLDVLDAEYIQFARSKGLAESTVIWKHGLRNAILPVLTLAGVYFGLFVTGGLVVEVVFAWPGLGRLAYTALLQSDYAVIQAFILLTGTIVIVVNLMVDIAYSIVDPRIRHS